jgi:hypothetical protein
LEQLRSDQASVTQTKRLSEVENLALLDLILGTCGRKHWLKQAAEEVSEQRYKNRLLFTFFFFLVGDNLYNPKIFLYYYFALLQNTL